MVVYKDLFLGVISPATPFLFFSFRDFPRLNTKSPQYEEYALQVLNWKRRAQENLQKALRDLKAASSYIEKHNGPEDAGLKVCQAQIRLIEGILEGQP